MSALRVRYETMQLKKRYETHQLLPEQTEHLLLLTQDSFDQWAARYPRDSWLASTGFLIATLYAELPGTDAREHAITLYVFVKSHFPHSSYATSSRAALHHGVATKADPAWAKEMRATSRPRPRRSPARLPPSPAASPRQRRPAVAVSRRRGRTNAHGKAAVHRNHDRPRRRGRRPHHEPPREAQRALINYDARARRCLALAGQDAGVARRRAARRGPLLLAPATIFASCWTATPSVPRHLR